MLECRELLLYLHTPACKRLRNSFVQYDHCRSPLLFVYARCSRLDTCGKGYLGNTQGVPMAMEKRLLGEAHSVWEATLMLGQTTRLLVYNEDEVLKRTPAGAMSDFDCLLTDLAEAADRSPADSDFRKLYLMPRIVVCPLLRTGKARKHYTRKRWNAPKKLRNNPLYRMCGKLLLSFLLGSFRIETDTPAAMPAILVPCWPNLLTACYTTTYNRYTRTYV